MCVGFQFLASFVTCSQEFMGRQYQLLLNSLEVSNFTLSPLQTVNGSLENHIEG